jgi:alkanesulfonate monooxygenase
MTIDVQLIGTCPTMNGSTGQAYLARIAEVSKWADDDGWEAILVYSDHAQCDPWIVAQEILRHTMQLRPLVALQPLYMHPLSAAKIVATLASMYGRQIYINLIAGGFPRDLQTLCDATPHDRRYDRVVEYASIMQDLLRPRGLCSFNGAFYNVKELQLVPRLPADKLPVFTISGSSPAGLAAAKKLGARAIQYLRPSYEYAGVTFDPSLQYGARLGVIVAETRSRAWEIARQRYPTGNSEMRKIRQYATSISDSVWVKELDKEIRVPPGHPYWLGPYHYYRTVCPFLVGDEQDVSGEIANYVRMGLRTFLLELPTNAEESRQITRVFKLACERARRS